MPDEIEFNGLPARRRKTAPWEEIPAKEMEEKSENDEEEEEENDKEDAEDSEYIDVSNFFNYQKAISSLMDYLNFSIEDTISSFTRSDQLLFTHPKKKLIMNAILESGFYEFCKYRLGLVAQSNAINDESAFMETIDIMQGEIDLLSYLLVHTRLAHRNLNFDLFLSLLKGGLFVDIMETHEKIVADMREKAKSLNKENIRDSLKVHDNQFYI